MPGSVHADETIDPQASRSSLGGADEKRPSAARNKGEARPAAKSPSTAPAASAAPLPEDALIGELRGKDEQALGAVKKLAALDTPRATEILLGELSLGVSPKVAGAILDVLLQKRSADGLPLLSLYARHRNPELRKRAVSALAALVVTPPSGTAAAAAPAEGAKAAAPAAKGAKGGGKAPIPAAPSLSAAQQGQVVGLLIASLADANTDVRAVAAEALGSRREKAAEPALIKLLLRKDAAAPAALGQIGGAETARALAEMIGTVPDRLLAETLGLLLIRPDFGPDPLRLEVVKTLGKLSGSQPIDLLSDYVTATAKDKADKARPSRTEAQKIIEQRTAK
ncbi:MAG: HEAT repeat domain-containing protein [Polyangia bacterium]